MPRLVPPIAGSSVGSCRRLKNSVHHRFRVTSSPVLQASFEAGLVDSLTHQLERNTLLLNNKRMDQVPNGRKPGRITYLVTRPLYSASRRRKIARE
jgi:hypothetical protein